MLQLIFTLLIAVQAQPNLQQVMTPLDDKVPIIKDRTPIPCDKIIQQLTDHSRLASQHEQSLVAFLNDVSTKAASWYADLSPLEGKTQTLTTGTFSAIQDGADKTTQITAMAADNASLLNFDMNHIIASLKACSLTTH